MNAVIIDDEENNIENLTTILHKYCTQIKVVGTAFNAQDGKELILKVNPDLVFLDIQMPGENAFQMLSTFTAFHFEIIFVSAFDNYGLQAIKFSALDYLLKPIRTSDLLAAVHKAVKRNEEKKDNELLRNLIHFVKNGDDRKIHRIALQSLKETRFVEPSKIVRCESDNSYTCFFLIDGTKITTSKPIFECEEQLIDYGFIRCHQSHIINVKMIKSWVKEDGGFVLLEDNSQVPISRNKKMELRKLLNMR